MTAGELHRRSGVYWEKLEGVKRGLPGVAWYPYCSLANFEHFAALLGPDADCDALLGAGPWLDIGCADGDLSFFLESLGRPGAIHALDHSGTNHNGLAGAAALREALGSRVEILDLNLDDGFELPARPYSLAFCLGLLYHVKNPFHLLESLGRYARTCLLSTRIMSHFPGGAPVPPYPAAYLLDPDELNRDETNFWIFNPAGLRRLARRAGWEIERFHVTGAVAASDPDSLERDERAFCLLRSRRWLANIVLGEGWHEESAEGWRWTARRFSFTPLGGPGRLTLCLHAPDALFAATGEPLRLDVAGGGSHLMERPGAHELAITAAAGAVTCELSRSLAPSPADERELGIIVTEVRCPAA